ncbi:hypothetical protein L6452_34515 [Arctium lappa]|uniref:Uncharacterized protein n=1 Tax=Arctium lappa TaxID=4217 RepID=A0ACB8YHN4_ARCLA|nr:hypothetical protein L6452_34515 [Arctium lappa]
MTYTSILPLPPTLILRSPLYRQPSSPFLSLDLEPPSPFTYLHRQSRPLLPPHPHLQLLTHTLSSFLEKPDILVVSYDDDVSKFSMVDYVFSGDVFPTGLVVVGRSFSSRSHMWLVGDMDLKKDKSKRAEEVRVHGVKSLVCIPTSYGLVELVLACDTAKEDGGLIQLTKATSN